MPIVNKINYHGTEYDMPMSVEKLTINQFFTSTNPNITISEFIVYKYGNIINMQRIVIQGNLTSGGDIHIGDVNPDYAPALYEESKWMRFVGTSDATFTMGSDDGEDVGLDVAVPVTANNTYMHNVVYLTNN